MVLRVWYSLAFSIILSTYVNCAIGTWHHEEVHEVIPHSSGFSGAEDETKSLSLSLSFFRGTKRTGYGLELPDLSKMHDKIRNLAVSCLGYWHRLITAKLERARLLNKMIRTISRHPNVTSISGYFGLNPYPTDYVTKRIVQNEKKSSSESSINSLSSNDSISFEKLDSETLSSVGEEKEEEKEKKERGENIVQNTTSCSKKNQRINALIKASDEKYNYQMTQEKEEEEEEETDEETTSDPFIGVEFTSGYINVTRGSMFYWYFPHEENDINSSNDNNSDNNNSDNNNSDIPTVIWLTGGPGCSSEIAVFVENGPFFMTNAGFLMRNENGWNQKANMLYIDQPLDTGFSTKNDNNNNNNNNNNDNRETDGESNIEEQISKDVREFLSHFLKKHPENVNKRFYLTGESYAGHFIPAIAKQLVFTNPVEGIRIEGIAIGNGWVQPDTQYFSNLNYAERNKLITHENYLEEIDNFEKCSQLIAQKRFDKAIETCGDASASLIGDRNPYNIDLMCETPPLCYDMRNVEKFLNKSSVQKRLGVRKPWADCNRAVFQEFMSDWIMRVGSEIKDLLNEGVQVTVYNGDRDFVCNWMGAEVWTANIPWRYQREFQNTPMRPWLPSVWLETAENPGDIRQHENFTFIRIFAAGHMVPMDRPEAALAMISEFLEKKRLPPVVMDKGPRELGAYYP